MIRASSTMSSEKILKYLRPSNGSFDSGFGENRENTGSMSNSSNRNSRDSEIETAHARFPSDEELAANTADCDEEIEERIIRMENKPLLCEPTSMQPTIYEIYNGQTTVKIKWPYSNQRFLKVILHTESPELVVDSLYRRFQNQYNFKQEVKIVFTDSNKASMFVSFRFDLYGRSYYVVPQPISGTCTESFRLSLRESTRRRVVMEKLDDHNSIFWFSLHTAPYTHLKSVSHPKYCLSFESEETAVMRRVKEDVKEENFHVDIIEVPLKPFSRTRGFLQRFSCFR